ncbi:PREDICTED: olfactory receptor 8U9-like [Calidris pugnax]|uniref:olfactory receptor 8U9-like n=1 Tax=Calidris pugnax TaxID=198806 RepID=UPI00071D65DC|nr:PREDICTED: olfactory receptor 8U9-like [Calidris pugnax]
MAGSNCTPVTEFSLTGFTKDLVAQLTLFLMFLLVYLFTILGNLGMITLIRASPQLCSPMYYFLGNLAFVDLCSSTVITPKMLVDFLSEKKGIAYAGCMAQVFIYDLFGMTECFLLAMIAYDRYMAICHPLMYPLVMSPKCCLQMVVGSYLMGLANGVWQTIGMSSLSFCSSNVLDLFFCDISLLISLSTSDTTLSYLILRTSASLFGMSSCLVVLVSYVAIISAILSIHSAEGKRKAFSTCASHLTTVSIFYGTALFMYLKPSSDSSREDKWAAVLYIVVTPMLNPLIYSLRNKEVKEALRRLQNEILFQDGVVKSLRAVIITLRLPTPLARKIETTENN